jgi:hypothetical protein
VIISAAFALHLIRTVTGSAVFMRDSSLAYYYLPIMRDCFPNVPRSGQNATAFGAICAQKMGSRPDRLQRIRNVDALSMAANDSWVYHNYLIYRVILK